MEGIGSADTGNPTVGGGGGGGSSGFDLGGFVQDIGFSSFNNMQNKKAASKQRKWDWSVARHAYRTAAVDLEKAGLNRILALGSPTNTPSAAVAKVDPAGNRTMIGAAVASAKQAIKESQAKEALLKEQTRQTDAIADKEQTTKALYEALEPLAKEIATWVREKTASNSGDARSPLEIITDVFGSGTREPTPHSSKPSERNKRRRSNR